jgi:lipopolysaccharide exporter
MTTLRVSARGLGLVRLVVLARILTPDAFGLVAVAVMANDLVNLLTATGFNIALVQREGEIKEYLDTVWTMLMIRGLVLAGIVVSIAPLLASYFDSPEATPYIQAMSIVLVLNGLTNSGMIYFMKELEVQKRFIWEISGALVDLAVAVPIALIMKNAWAIVLGSIAGWVVRVIISFVIHPYRPRFKIDLEKAKELFGFGMWVLFTAISLYVFTRMDSIFVGRVLGVVTLGLYTIAYSICRPIADEIGQVATVVVFPAYAKIQGNMKMLRQSSLAALELVSLITFPIAVIFYILGPDFIPLMLGDQWTEAIPAFQLLGIATAMFSLHSIGGALFWGLGKPKLRFFMMGTGSIIMLVLLMVLTGRLGITGAALSVIGGNIGALVFLFISLKLMLELPFRDIVKKLSSSFLLCFVLSGALILVKNTMSNVGIGQLILLLFVTILVYAGFSVVAWKSMKTGPISIYQWFRGKSQIFKEGI